MKHLIKIFQVVSRVVFVFFIVFLGVQTARAQTATVVGRLEAPFGDGSNIVIKDNLAVISDEQIGEVGGGFFIVDVSNPAAPVQLSQIQLAEAPEKGIATDIAVRGNLAFMPVFKADSNAISGVKKDGLAIFDISDPMNPALKSNVAFPTTVVSDVAVRAEFNLFYSSNPAREELSIGVFDPILGIASLVATLDIPRGASCVAVTGTGLGVVVGDTGATPQNSALSIVDPVTQTILGSVDFTNDLIALGVADFDPFGVVVTKDDRFAFVSGGFISDNIVVIDISDTTAPEFVTAIPTNGGNPFGLSLAGDLLFVTNALNDFPNSLLSIVDVSDPENPMVVTTIDPQGILVDVATRVDNVDSNGNITAITAITVNADFQFAPFNTPGGITVIEVTP